MNDGWDGRKYRNQQLMRQPQHMTRSPNISFLQMAPTCIPIWFFGRTEGEQFFNMDNFHPFSHFGSPVLIHPCLKARRSHWGEEELSRQICCSNRCWRFFKLWGGSWDEKTSAQTHILGDFLGTLSSNKLRAHTDILLESTTVFKKPSFLVIPPWVGWLEDLRLRLKSFEKFHTKFSRKVYIKPSWRMKTLSFYSIFIDNCIVFHATWIIQICHPYFRDHSAKKVETLSSPVAFIHACDEDFCGTFEDEWILGMLRLSPRCRKDSFGLRHMKAPHSYHLYWNTLFWLVTWGAHVEREMKRIMAKVPWSQDCDMFIFSHSSREKTLAGNEDVDPT